MFHSVVHDEIQRSVHCGAIEEYSEITPRDEKKEKKRIPMHTFRDEKFLKVLKKVIVSRSR